MANKTTVKKGQTFSQISKVSNVPEDELRKANPGVKTLKQGQVIKVPNPLGGQGVMGGTNKSGPTFTTGAGERKEVVLPNGQKVRMAPNSNLTYAPPQQQTFGGALQNIYNTLTGQTPAEPGGEGGVRGSKSRGLAAPSKNPFLGGQGVMGGTNKSGPTFTTGSEKRTVVLPNGQTVRMAPNSNLTYTPPQQQTFGGVMQNIYNTLTGQTPAEPGGQGGVRGAKPGGLASPRQNVFSGTQVYGGTGVAPATRMNPLVQQPQQPPLRPQPNQTPSWIGGQSVNPLNGQYSPVGLNGQASAVPTGNGGTAGYWAQYNQQQGQQPFLGSSQYLDPRYQQGQNQQGQTQTNKVPRPTTQYTGDPNDPSTAQWKAYWNAAATNPSQYQEQAPPKVMTREEVWQMKAEQRRRRGEEQAADGNWGSGGGNFSGGNFSGDNQNQWAQYDPGYVRTITWGI